MAHTDHRGVMTVRAFGEQVRGDLLRRYDPTSDEARAADGEHDDRLGEREIEWSPENQFRPNRNVAPARGTATGTEPEMEARR